MGGQGVVLLGNILREYGMRTALIKNVVGTETRGVSQRDFLRSLGFPAKKVQ